MGETQTLPYYPRVDGATIRSLRTPLRLILAGWFFVFFDITYGESAAYSFGGPSGWEVDFLHDSIGYACLIVAYGHLNRATSPRHARRFIPAMIVIAALGTVASLCDMYIGWPELLSAVCGSLYSVAATLATLALAWTMMEICRAAGANDLDRAWKKATIAVGVLWSAPICILSLVSVPLALAGTDPIHIGPDSGAAALTMLAVFALPLFWLGAAWYKTFRWTPPGLLTHCHICGYQIAGIPEPKCPECGTVFATDRPGV